MNKEHFFICKSCGALIELLVPGRTMSCCGIIMTELVPNTVEASQEKHLPVIENEGNLAKVSVGSVPHPMETAHHIVFIVLVTDRGVQRKMLAVGSPAVATFAIEGETVLAAYTYCNLHGLWKTHA